MEGESVVWRGAWVVAVGLLEALAPACQRIEIAGSLRRLKAEVFGRTKVDLLEERLAALMANGLVAPRLVENHRADGSVDLQTKLGPAFKALVTPRGVPVDLFIVRPPATWGCIFALRTGPGIWNTRLVTECKTIGRRVAGGQVERWTGHRWEAVPTPEEADFFAALGQPWVDPAERHVDRVHIDRAIADGVPA